MPCCCTDIFKKCIINPIDGTTQQTRYYLDEKSSNNLIKIDIGVYQANPQNTNQTTVINSNNNQYFSHVSQIPWLADIKKTTTAGTRLLSASEKERYLDILNHPYYLSQIEKISNEADISFNNAMLKPPEISKSKLGISMGIGINGEYYNISLHEDKDFLTLLCNFYE